MTRRKPWPSPTSGEYTALVRGARTLTGVAEVAMKHGVGRHRNVPLLKRLLPMTADEARGIHLVCCRVWAKKHRQKERWPNWAARALDETAGLAAEAGELGNAAVGYLEQDNWPAMERSLREVLRIGQEIEARLLEGPPPETLSAEEMERESAEVAKRIEQLAGNANAGGKK